MAEGYFPTGSNTLQVKSYLTLKAHFKVFSVGDEIVSIRLVEDYPLKVQWSFSSWPNWDSEKNKSLPSCTSTNSSSCETSADSNFNSNCELHAKQFYCKQPENEVPFNFNKIRERLEKQLNSLEARVNQLIDDVSKQLSMKEKSPKHTKVFPQSVDGFAELSEFCRDNHKFLVVLIHHLLHELQLTRSIHEQSIDKLKVRYEKLRRIVKWLQTVPQQQTISNFLGAGDQRMEPIFYEK